MCLYNYVFYGVPGFNTEGQKSLGYVMGFEYESEYELATRFFIFLPQISKVVRDGIST